jgi:hypothetical protein
VHEFMRRGARAHNFLILVCEVLARAWRLALSALKHTRHTSSSCIFLAHMMCGGGNREVPSQPESQEHDGA